MHYSTCTGTRSSVISLLVALVFGPARAGMIDPSCRMDAPDCVCSMERAQEELNRKFLSLQRAELENALRRFRCVDNFERLPRSLLVDASQTSYISPATGDFIHDDGDLYDKRKFRYLRRKKRQVLVGVPTDQVFSEAVAQLNPTALHRYAVLGSFVQFTCVGTNIDALDDIDPHARRFEWVHYNGAPVTAPQTTVDHVTGILMMRSVQLSDTGIYNCTIEYTSENGKPASKVFSHQLSVVSEPLFTLQFALRYTSDSCQRVEKILISDHLTPWIQQFICPYCQVHSPAVHCVHGAPEQPPSVREYDVLLIVSLANANFRFDRSSAYYEHMQSCSVSCSELYQVKLLEIVRDSLVKLFSLPIEISMGNRNPPIIHRPIPQTLDMELLLGCLSGFHLNFKLCFPCDVGHFSPDGNSACFPCEIGSYQPLPGSSSCIPCKNNYKTLQQGSSSHSDCIVSTLADLNALFLRYTYIFIGVFGTLLLIIIILVAIRCCCPTSSRVGRCVNVFCCCCCPAEDRYGYEESARARTRTTDEVNMVEFRGAPKPRPKFKERPLAPAPDRSKIKYKKIPVTESDHSDREQESKDKHKSKKSRRRDKTKRSAVASNAPYRTKSYANSGNILLKKTAYEDEEDNLDETISSGTVTSATTTTTSSRQAMRKILSDGDSDGDQDKVRLVIPTGQSSPSRKHPDPLALHRCAHPSCSPSPRSKIKSILHPQTRPRQSAPAPGANANINNRIPKPPPLPNIAGAMLV